MLQDNSKEYRKLIEELAMKASIGPAQTEDFICNYCLKPFKSFNSRANHWNKTQECKTFHRIQRAEQLLQKLECLGCQKIFNQSIHCERHMKKCKLVDQNQIPEKQNLIEQKQLDSCSYQQMKILKYDKDKNLKELQIPLHVFEVKGGYICKAWENKYKQYMAQGKPIKLRVDVRNDDFWFNLHKIMLKLTGSLFSIVVEDNPWKGQKSTPYEYLPNHRLKEIPLSLIQEEGVIFYWTLCNSQNEGAIHLRQNGYVIIKTVVWVKLTTKGNLINSKKPEYSQEYCIIGVKGNYDIQRLNQIPDIIRAERTAHSEKPKDFWNIIDDIFQGQYRLEIFTRSHADKDFTVHVGNEIDKDKEMMIETLY